MPWGLHQIVYAIADAVCLWSLNDSSVRKSASVKSQALSLVAADTQFLAVNADWASWSLGQMLSVYALPGQWLAVNSMFINNESSLFIDVGRASCNFLKG